MASGNVRMYSLYKDIYPQKQIKQDMILVQKERDQMLEIRILRRSLLNKELKGHTPLPYFCFYANLEHNFNAMFLAAL